MSSDKTGKKTIASIQAKKKKAIVIFDDGTELEMGLHSFTDQPLYEGKEVSLGDFAQLEKAAKRDDYLDYALRLCASGSKTEAEVVSKLQSKKADPETIREICTRLKNQGFIDDPMYARVYATDIADLKLYGRKKVLFDLKRKGIPEEILQALPEEEEAEKARAVRLATILNKRNDGVPNGNKKSKLIHGLMERGFDQEVAQYAASCCASFRSPASEKNALKKDYFGYRAKYEKKAEGYALRQKIYAALIRKGYRSEDIQAIMEENENAD